MTSEEMANDAAEGAAYMLAEGATEGAKSAVARMSSDFDAAGLTIAEGGFVVAWLASSLLTDTWPTKQKHLTLAAVANLALHFHQTMQDRGSVAASPVRPEQEIPN